VPGRGNLQNRHMPQMKSARAKVRTDVQDLKEGLRGAPLPGTEPPAPGTEASIAAWKAGARASALLKVVLYGFIVVRPAVPFLPWGEPTAMTAALALTALATALVVSATPTKDRPLRLRGWMELVLFVAALGVAVVASTTAPTSLVTAGALVTLLTLFARLRPYVYALVGGVFLAGVLMQVFDLSLFNGAHWGALSRGALAPDAAGRQATLIAAVVFLAGAQHVVNREVRTQRQRAEAAELARDEAAADERARIARELHDVVSHHVTAMTLQAEAAVATGDRAVLESLANSGREAAAELRRMLGVLRHPAEESPTQPPDPQPRLTDLDGLARRLSSGVEVTVERTGEPRPLPAGVELCAYRLVQEALTNVAKHSDARRASVAIDYAPRRLKIEVVDDGQPVQRVRESGGHGLIGMRERVSLLDGELEVGPRQAQRGYRVFASIPL